MRCCEQSTERAPDDVLCCAAPRSVCHLIANRSLTHAAHLLPPYARLTLLSRLCSERYTLGRTAGMPCRSKPQSPHLGTFDFLVRYWKTSLPPGVFTFLTLLDFVRKP